jgi:hypothetical protein
VDGSFCSPLLYYFGAVEQIFIFSQLREVLSSSNLCFELFVDWIESQNDRSNKKFAKLLHTLSMLYGNMLLIIVVAKLDLASLWLLG